MRTENHGAEVPEMAWSLLLSSQPLAVARSHPREGAGGSADGPVPSPLCESSHLVRLSVHRPALARSLSDPGLSLLLPKLEVTTQGDMAWGSLAAGAWQLPPLRCGGGWGGCFLQRFCTHVRLADGRIKRLRGSCPVRAARTHGRRYPAPQYGSWQGCRSAWGRERFWQWLLLRIPHLGSNNVAGPQVFLLFE